ncbi:GntR family transcriptional regulator [Terrilactibacillus sp. S3-3]|nr:GntR family transcriptional regulator [Terrilactibacillus sp. S3-3]
MIIVSETVQKFLVDYIKKRNMQPGDKLPSERELVEMLEVGRSSVREALQILTERGIIEKRPGKGAYLKSNFFQCHTNNLQLLIPAMDISTSLDMLEFRKGIETENAFLAAKRRDHESIQTLERSVIDLENCVKKETNHCS